MMTTATIPTALPGHAMPASTLRFTRRLTAWLPCAVFLLMAVMRSDTSCDADEVDLPSRLPGLVAEFKTAAGEPARRVDHLMQHKWTNPQQLDERLDESKPVEITWEGLLELKAEGRYQLHVYAAGQFQLTLGGQEIAAGQHDSGGWFAGRAVDLPFGFHPLKLHFNSSQPGGAVALYWQGPAFELEPISERYLAHASGQTADDDFQRGRLLAHALRCAACHASASLTEPIAAPALTRLAGNLETRWLREWLTSKSAVPLADDVTADDQVERRMPHFAMSDSDAADIVAALWSASVSAEANSATSERTAPKPKTKSETAGKSKDKSPPRTKPDAEHGRVVFDTQGCVACHPMAEREIGGVDTDDDATYLPHNRFSRFSRELFEGGDLSFIADKRPADFFARWLAEPAKINADHRMPVAELSALQREDVSLYLATLKRQANETQSEIHSKGNDRADGTAGLSGNASRGEKLLAEHRCSACHKLPPKLAASATDLRALTAKSNWDAGCLAEPVSNRRVPGFGLTVEQRRWVKNYWLSAQRGSGKASDQDRKKRTTPADLLLTEHNCTACHARGAEQGITARVENVVALERDLASRLPTLIPPSLTGVGDKLHDHALHAAIERREDARRPWLEVRMPKYALDASERARLVEHLITQDRIPERESQNVKLPDDVVTRAAAGRLLTSEGFGCQSCHQIGRQQPPAVALSARGTDLTMLGDRIRHPWFDRWVRNPVRIVPRMEMPAIQLPVHGVLGDNLGRQIDAVWEMLNTRGFQPPTPAPVRIVRGHNLPGKSEAAHVLTDVLETSGQNYLRPLIIGLGNRHNLLFDLEKAELAQWWIGDTARELTRGKSWYWEIGGQPLAQKLESLGKLILVDDRGQVLRAAPTEQFATELDAMQHTPAGVRWQGRISFGLDSDRRVIPMEMAIEPITSSGAATNPTSGMSLLLTTTLPSGHALGLQLDPLTAPLLSPEQSSGQRLVGEKSASWSTQLDDRSRLSLSSTSGHAVVSSEHQWRVSSREPGQPVRLSLRLETEWTVDRFVDAPVMATVPIAGADGRRDIQAARAERLETESLKAEPLTAEPIKLDVVPGFDAVQLPLPRDEMPTALAWHGGELIVGSLKGRVCRAIDLDRDGLAETWQAISDDFPAPYGLASHGEEIDVLVKFGLVRLTKPEDPALPWSWRVVADGWGYTADYHDWAVGLPKDKANNYFVALPCQQDDRTPSSARLRGTIQKLIPQSPTSEHPREYRLETFAAGQRFPMGIAFNREGDLFATDNQGNYNPFNELNHLQLGKRYGFINKLEVKPGFNPPLESPAVNLPHPWTRSVNGICFLNTPPTAESSAGFGPYEGHLVGCEYNGLSLIRMSLEMVDGVYQGAAYLFSKPPENGEPTFEGPVVCEVSPAGDLTVGNIHDSGWGGGQNTGSIVRLTPNGRWPLGIATVSATEEGLSIQFTGEIDPAAASQTANYTLRSYRRMSTPAYGGADQEEREEMVLQARVEPGSTRVKLRLKDLRADSVYELRVGAVAGPSTKLFPAEAHYTMKRVPTASSKQR